VADHPAEDLGRSGQGRERRRRAGSTPERGGGREREEISEGGGREQRTDEMRAAALVLLRALLPMLVRPDDDVLGAVVRGELGTAQRDQRGDRRVDNERRGTVEAQDSLFKRSRSARPSRARKA